MMSLKTGILTVMLLFSSWSTAQELLKPGHPSVYEVVKGDTLWDISDRFLNSPWRWPEIWHINANIKNPHLIYPGDKLELVYVNGRPQLKLSRGPKIIKLSPTVGRKPLNQAIPTVPVDAIVPFLSQPRVLEQEQLKSLPYIVSYGSDHIIGATGITAYVRSIEESNNKKFAIVRPGNAYKDGDTGEVLGYDAAYIGTAALRETGDPATVLITSSESEAWISDLLLEIDEEKRFRNFTPSAPDSEVEGNIISVFGGVSEIGQYAIVVLDRGQDNGLKEGSVLEIVQRGETVRDTVTPDSRDVVTLPDRIAGNMMVFRTFDRVSFAIVMETTRSVHIGDAVRSPSI